MLIPVGTKVKYGEIYGLCILSTENHAIVVREEDRKAHHIVAEDMEKIEVIE